MLTAKTSPSTIKVPTALLFIVAQGAATEWVKHQVVIIPMIDGRRTHIRRNALSTDVPGTQGSNFTIDDQAGHFPGTNSYWISYLTDDADVDLVLDPVSASSVSGASVM
ncbi:uncharacterized protein N7459_005085 [Penicillium hispanicum]|uniref:uncharacterized protein n=1 Tax=Penicillium hispanicum TaxID=1080232 RepID=UPI00254055C2|nr:uncharacterized protein N7459_005085 [Penicillium hispanicum]KAJ5585285.1 hypothetical protein N7459_005085 [Penicillium hispanicum]